jgi:diaminohydroxyphosphoribosylaminopyrimidine deaminase/5-amino-6-(5-phosphoribosylamino)uracil reductase
LQSGLVDRIYWFRAPIVIGNDGLAVANDGFSTSLATLPMWKPIDKIPLENDMLEIYERMDPGSSPG